MQGGGAHAASLQSFAGSIPALAHVSRGRTPPVSNGQRGPGYRG